MRNNIDRLKGAGNMRRFVYIMLFLLFFTSVTFAETARLPNVGGDIDTWGDLLNHFLLVSHNPDGTLNTTNQNLTTNSLNVTTDLTVLGNLYANAIYGSINASNITSGTFGGSYIFQNNLTLADGFLYGTSQLQSLRLLNGLGSSLWYGLSNIAVGSNLITFATNGSEKARIDASGNVGIGTTSPNFKLDVNGTISGYLDWSNITNKPVIPLATTTLPMSNITGYNGVPALPMTNITGFNGVPALPMANVTGFNGVPALPFANITGFPGVTIPANNVTGGTFPGTVYIFTDLIVNRNLTVFGSITNANVTNLGLNGSLYPTLTSIFDIGSPSLLWNNGYFKNAVLVNGIDIFAQQKADNSTLFNLIMSAKTTTLPMSNITGFNGVPSLPMTNITGFNGVPSLPMSNITGFNGVPALPMANVTGFNGVPALPWNNITNKPNFGVTLPMSNVTGYNGVPSLPMANVTGFNGVPALPMSNVTGFNGVPSLPYSNLTNTPQIVSSISNTDGFLSVTSGSNATINFNLSAGDARWASGGLALFLYNTSSNQANHKVMNTSVPTGSQKTVSFTGIGTDSNLLNWTTNGSSLLYPTFLKQGNGDFHIHAQKTGGTMGVVFYGELHEELANGTDNHIATTVLSSSVGSSISDFDLSFFTNEYVLNSTGSLHFHLYANATGSGSAPSLNIFIEGSTDSRLELPVTSSLISIINTESDPIWTSQKSQYQLLLNGITLPMTNITGFNGVPTLPFANITGFPGVTIPMTNVTGFNGVPSLPMANITGFNGVPSLPMTNVTGYNGVPALPFANITGFPGVTLPMANITGFNGVPALPWANLTGIPNFGVTLPMTNVTGFNGVPSLPWANLSGVMPIYNLTNQTGYSWLNIIGSPAIISGVTLPMTNITGFNGVPLLPMTNITGFNGVPSLPMANVTGFNGVPALPWNNITNKPNFGVTLPMANVTGFNGVPALPFANITGFPGFNVVPMANVTGFNGVPALPFGNITGFPGIVIPIANVTGFNATCPAGSVLQNHTSAGGQCVAVSTGSSNITSSASSGYIPYMSSATNLANSPFYVSGTNIGFNTTTPLALISINSGSTGNISGITLNHTRVLNNGDEFRITWGNSNIDAIVAMRKYNENDTGVRIYTTGTSTSTTGSAFTLLDSNHVMGYNFSEASGNFADYTGNGNTGVATATITYQQPAIIGKGATFSGGYSTTATTTDLQSSTFSIEAWVNFTSTGWQVIVGKAEGSDATSQFFLEYTNANVWCTPSEDHAFAIVLRSNTGWNCAIASTPLVTGREYYVVGTFDGTNMRIFLNGTLYNTTAIAGTYQTTTASLRIGRRAEGDAQLGATVDDVLYSKINRTASYVASVWGNQSYSGSTLTTTILANVTSVAVDIHGNGSITFPYLAGSGTGYLCVDANGSPFRKASACV